MRARRSRNSRRSSLLTSALGAEALALDALAAPRARIALQRAIQLDAITILATVTARARLAEDTDRRAVPGNLGGKIRRSLRARRGQGIGDARRGGQLDAPEVLPLAQPEGDRAALADAWRRLRAHGSERARATKASTSEPMVAANFGSNNMAVSRWLKAKRMLSSTRQPSGSIGVSRHSPSSMRNGPLTSCMRMRWSGSSVLRVVNSPCNVPCLTPRVATISVGVRDNTRAWVHQGRNCG